VNEEKIGGVILLIVKGIESRNEQEFRRQKEKQWPGIVRGTSGRREEQNDLKGGKENT